MLSKYIGFLIDMPVHHGFRIIEQVSLDVWPAGLLSNYGERKGDNYAKYCDVINRSFGTRFCVCRNLDFVYGRLDSGSCCRGVLASMYESCTHSHCIGPVV